MKNLLTCILILSAIIIPFAAGANAATLTGVYDFSDHFDGVTTSFEGLAFTDNGTLWVTSAPNGGQSQLIGLQLDEENKTGTVLSAADYQVEETETVPFFFFDLEVDTFNPVGLASDGTNLIVASNRKALDNYVYTDLEPTGDLARSTYDAMISNAVCEEPEGSAYLNGYIYLSCEDSKNVVRLNPATGKVVEVFSSETALLGLGATEDSLIFGDYQGWGEDRVTTLRLYNVAENQVTMEIDLRDLFPDYAVTDPNGSVRYVPDPDGIAYRNGKIYMSFEHDPRIFEVSLVDPPAATPEPGTLLLIGAGLLGLALLRKEQR